MEEMLIEKVRQRTFLYDTKSPDYRDQHMRANAWERIGKELKIKRKFYVFTCLCDVRIVCPRPKTHIYVVRTCQISSVASCFIIRRWAPVIATGSSQGPRLRRKLYA